MRVTFRAIEETLPGAKWQTEVRRLLPAYRKWFLREGDAARPTYMACVRSLRAHMPELVGTFDILVELAGGSDPVARLLSLYRPTPYLTGCSQAVWTRGAPALIRNYDYSPKLWEANLWHTSWNGRGVIAMTDCAWGVLDGFNDAGLAISLAFGGRKVVGEGFGIPLVLRYILEFFDTTSDAVGVLSRVPSHMAYNVTIVDASGDHATVYVSPDRPASVTRRAVATNHQNAVEWDQFAHATASVDRERYLIARRMDEGETLDRFAERFLYPPLLATKFAQGWGTLYTAVYRPETREVEYRWPGVRLTQSFNEFSELRLAITYDAATAAQVAEVRSQPSDFAEKQ